VRITSIQRPKADGDARVRLASSGRLQLPWREPFTVRFAVLDFTETPHEYAYRLGPDAEWNDHGQSREITFFGLGPGRHELEVRGRDAFGSWSPAERLVIDVVPPLWMTRWFQAAAVTGLFLLLLAGHRRRMRGLKRKHLALLELTRRLESAKEEERRHISRELHDELGQTLTATKLHLQLLGRDAADPASAARLAEPVAMLDSMIGQVRQMSLGLRPPLLDELGLGAALEQFLKGLSQRTGTQIDFECRSGVGGSAPEVEAAAFRVVQEAVNNALRHADAGRITVELSAGKDGELAIRVADDGRGFDVEQVRPRLQRGGHLGLLGMEERVRALGGRLEIDTGEGRGCVIEARIPRQ
jgi:signal transduction histidine kinase